MIKQILVFLSCLIIWQSTILAQGWQWYSPYPTGQDLNDVHFADECTGWIVGDKGTILKTLSGGNQWFSIYDSLYYNFKACFAQDRERIWVVGDGTEFLSVPPYYNQTFKILHSSDGGKQWETVLDGLDWVTDTLRYHEFALRDISFPSETVGWAAGDSGLLVRSTDGGIHWEVQPPPTEHHIETIQFLDESVGYLSGGILHFNDIPYPFDSTFSHGIIMKTVDGGAHWEAVFDDSVKIHQIHFLDAQTGWAIGTAAWMRMPYGVGRAQYIYKTTDGGQSWQHGLFNGGIEMPSGYRIHFVTADLGFVASEHRPLLRSTDGGANWEYISSEVYTERFFSSIHFTSATNGYMVGQLGVIKQTEDGGETWSGFPQSSVDDMRDAFFFNPDTGFIIDGSETLYRTENGGDSWSATGLNRIWAIDFPDDENGWAVGGNGTIWRSSDSGLNWQQQSSPTDEYLRTVKFANSSTGWAAGHGITIKTSDGGENWFVQNPGNGGLDIVLQDSLRLWVHYGGSFFTQDGGVTWQSSADTFGIYQFLNADTGWARAYNSPNHDLLRTFDGGNTWELIGQHTLSYKLDFADVENGWVDMGYAMIATNDGGATWETEFRIDVYRTIYNLHFIDKDHGWAGGNNVILRYGYPEKAVPIDSTCDKISALELPIGPSGVDKSFSLYQNYPNPFNNSTVLEYELSQTGFVKMRIYDLLGREVWRFNAGKKLPGIYHTRWNGKNNEGEALPSGIYFFRLSVSDEAGAANIQSAIAKMLLVR